MVLTFFQAYAEGAVTWTTGNLFTPNPTNNGNKFAAVTTDASGTFHFALGGDGTTNDNIRVGYYTPSSNSVTIVSSFGKTSTSIFDNISDDIVSF